MGSPRDSPNHKYRTTDHQSQITILFLEGAAFASHKERQSFGGQSATLSRTAPAWQDLLITNHSSSSSAELDADWV
jgi:hypothetical protein